MLGIMKRTTPAMLACLVFWSVSGHAQEIPRDYQEVLKSLDHKGDFKDGVLKVNIPRNDLKMTVQGISTPTPFGFGGWVAFTKTTDGNEVMMGDLVLLQDEVNPVMSALLDNGIDVTALHNHFLWDDPHVFYMHVHGMGNAADLARRVTPAFDLIEIDARLQRIEAECAAALARERQAGGREQRGVELDAIFRPALEIAAHRDRVVVVLKAQIFHLGRDVEKLHRGVLVHVLREV